MLFNLKNFSIFLSLFALQVAYPLSSNPLSDNHKFYLRIHGIIEARRYPIEPLESDPSSYCLSRDPLFAEKCFIDYWNMLSLLYSAVNYSGYQNHVF